MRVKSYVCLALCFLTGPAAQLVLAAARYQQEMGEGNPGIRGGRPG